MKNFKLSVLVSAFLLSACGGTTAVKQEPKPMQAEAPAKQASEPMQKQAQAKMVPSLNEAQLKSLLVGNTQVGLEKGKNWINTYNPDGTLIGSYGSNSDNGTYTIKGNQMCRKWNKWRKGTTACWTMQKRDKDYYANLQSGDSESYSFAMK